MLDACPLDARIKPVAHLILVVAVEFAAQESGDVVRLYRVNGGARQPLINGLQVALMPEHDVGGKLDLIQAPVIIQPELLYHRAVEVGELVQFAVQHPDPELVGQFLCLPEVGNPAEGIIHYPVFDVVFAHLPRQNAVTVTVKLKPEWAPCWEPQ